MIDSTISLPPPSGGPWRYGFLYLKTFAMKMPRGMWQRAILSDAGEGCMAAPLGRYRAGRGMAPNYRLIASSGLFEVIWPREGFSEEVLVRF